MIYISDGRNNSLSFHIMFYRCVVKHIVYGNTLRDCDLYTPRDERQNEHKTRSSLLNEDYICSMDTDFNLLKHKQSYTRARLFLCERSAFFSTDFEQLHKHTYMRQNPRLCKYPR